MKKIVYLALLVVLFGCEEEMWPPCETPLDNYDTIPLYIDSSCQINETIVRKVETLNTFTESVLCEPLVEIIGTIDVDQEDYTLPVNTISCYAVETTWYYDSEYTDFIGYSEYFTNIRLFLFKAISKKQLNTLILHELFHYVGIVGHSSRLTDVSNADIPLTANYTEGDKGIFCADGEYVCQN